MSDREDMTEAKRLARLDGAIFMEDEHTIRMPMVAIQLAIDRFVILDQVDHILSVSWVRSRWLEAGRWGCRNVEQKWWEQLEWLTAHPEVATN